MKILILIWLVFACSVNNADCKGGGRGGGGKGEDGLLRLLRLIFDSRSKFSGRHTYPASSGYSGFGSGGSRYPFYPASSGYSGYGSGGSRQHSYPSSFGFPGYGSGGSRKYYSYYDSEDPRMHPAFISSGFPAYGSSNFPFPNGFQNTLGFNLNPMHLLDIFPSSISKPKVRSCNKEQYAYVGLYKNSESRYKSLLAGLALYNIDRSRRIRHHYYQDRAYKSDIANSSFLSNRTQVSCLTPIENEKSKDEAYCVMRIIDSSNDEALKIPCMLVTTFTKGVRQISDACIVGAVIMCDNSSTRNATLKNSTDILFCNSSIRTLDPLSVIGPPLNTSGVECRVEIWREREVISNILNCSTLLRFDKRFVPAGRRNFPTVEPIFGERPKLKIGPFDNYSLLGSDKPKPNNNNKGHTISPTEAGPGLDEIIKNAYKEASSLTENLPDPEDLLASMKQDFPSTQKPFSDRDVPLFPSPGEREIKNSPLRKIPSASEIIDLKKTLMSMIFNSDDANGASSSGAVPTLKEQIKNHEEMINSYLVGLPEPEEMLPAE